MEQRPKYLPFLSGGYSTLPGLNVTAREQNPMDRMIFQIDDAYDHYLQNKQACRNECMDKYYQEARLEDEAVRAVNRYLCSQLLHEYPDTFSMPAAHTLVNSRTGKTIRFSEDWVHCESDEYQSLLDALCCQVQEDLAVFKVNGNEDYLAAVHLCAPNHWSPAEKIGKPFGQIHLPVADMEKTIAHYPRMLQSIVEKGGPFTRFAWGIGTDRRLNHHPIAPPDSDKEVWEGRTISSEKPSFYLRIERQNLVGLPSVQAFLFTIRTYFYEVESLSDLEKEKLREAIAGMSRESLVYKGLTGLVSQLNTLLSC